MKRRISNEKKLKKIAGLFEEKNKHIREYGRKVAIRNKKKKSNKLASDIRRMRQTMTVKDVADHIGIHEKSVYRILRKYPEENVTSGGENVTVLKPQKRNLSRQKQQKSVENNVTFGDGKSTENVTSGDENVTVLLNPGLNLGSQDVNPSINKKERNNSITQDPQEIFSEILQVTMSWQYSVELYSLQEELLNTLDSDISYSEKNGNKLSLLLRGIKKVSRFEPTLGLKMLEVALNLPRL